MEQGAKFKLEIGVVVAAVIVAVLAYFGWRAWRSGEVPPPEEQTPFEVPETNPFKSKTNPFEGVYKNPFD